MRRRILPDVITIPDSPRMASTPLRRRASPETQRSSHVATGSNILGHDTQTLYSTCTRCALYPGPSILSTALGPDSEPPTPRDLERLCPSRPLGGARPRREAPDPEPGGGRSDHGREGQNVRETGGGGREHDRSRGGRAQRPPVVEGGPLLRRSAR